MEFNFLELVERPHDYKKGDSCEYLEPNVKENTMFMKNGEVIGFYLKKLPPEVCKIADFCNKELLSDRVPKTEMSRSDVIQRKYIDGGGVKQFSTILGSVPPCAFKRRPYPSASSVHGVASASYFIKAMMLLSAKCEEIIKEIAPSIYEKQVALIEENVKKEFRFGKLFTSSISNFNIAANFHTDNANIKGCVNVIVTKRKDSMGGSTFVPDYGAVMGSEDNSLLVYPAWQNMHAVTPIIQKREGGYRNSLVFYPLKGFK